MLAEMTTPTTESPLTGRCACGAVRFSVADMLVPVAPDGLANRLHNAGLAETVVSRSASSFRFRARKPAAATR